MGRRRFGSNRSEQRRTPGSRGEAIRSAFTPDRAAATPLRPFGGRTDFPQLAVLHISYGHGNRSDNTLMVISSSPSLKFFVLDRVHRTCHFNSGLTLPRHRHTNAWYPARLLWMLDDGYPV